MSLATRETRYEHHFHVRPSAVDFFRESCPAHLRHHDVGHDQVHLTLGAAHQSQRGGTILGLEYVVTVRTKNARHELPHTGLVVDDEHAFVAAAQ